MDLLKILVHANFGLDLFVRVWEYELSFEL
jgi:hypothetical protein